MIGYQVMSIHKVALIALAVSMGSFAGAKASTVTDHFDISVLPGAFTGINTNTSGVAPALGSSVTTSFDITFDTSLTYTDATSGITNFTHSFVDDSGVGFSYDPATQFLTVGGLSDGAGSAFFNTNDFYLHITNFTTTQTFQQIGFTTAGGLYYFTPTSTGVSIGITPVVSAVPLPGSLALFGAAILGLAGLGVAQGKRQSAKLTSKIA